MTRVRLTAAALLSFCVACSPINTDSRYGDAKDTAPVEDLSASDVRDAVPRADPILAAGNASPYSVDGTSYEILGEYKHYRQRGIASWYGTRFHGHKTSNGEIYDLYEPSAAHKTLPIPCYARVTNLNNGRNVVVRVNDRGPFHGDRLIDLSYAAALKLGFVRQGTAPVEVAVVNVAGVDDRREREAGEYRYLQMAAFSSRASADDLAARLGALLTTPVLVSEVEADGRSLYRVRVGPMDGPTQLQSVQAQLLANGYEGGLRLP